MEIINEQSFIIKRFLPHQQKISVITQSRGKVYLPIKDPMVCNKLWPGMIVTYTLWKKRESSFEMSNLEIIELFGSNSLEETSWVHHILELCHFFAPLDNPCDEIFLFLTQYFYLFHVISPVSTQRISFYLASMIKLLTLFDFQPTPQLIQFINLFDRLVANSIDFCQEQNIESIKENLQAIPEKAQHHARLWGMECIKNHPCFASFKTVDILR